jgi:hypothetical protein
VTGRTRRPHQGGSSTPNTRGQDGELSLPHPSEEANLAIVTGTIMEEPVRDRSRGGHPVTVLLIGFKAPDEEAHDHTACLEVEALDSIAESQRNLLRVGRRLVVLGRLTGAGGLWATALIADVPKHPGHGMRRRS